MAEIEKKKISELPVAGALSDSDIFPVVQAGETKRASGLQLKGYASASGSAAAGVAIISAGSATLAVAANTLVQAVIITGNTGTVKLGTSASAGDLLDDAITTGVPYVLPAFGYFSNSSTTIHITGTCTVRFSLLSFS